LCHFLFQSPRGNGAKWVDEDVAVTSYRLKQTDNTTLIEEYNPRSEMITVHEIVQITDNELQMIDKGDTERKIKVYKRK
jgi:hypothetical protein